MNSLTDVDWSSIPAPEDDGGTDHLQGARMASVSLMATSGDKIDLGAVSGLVVLYAYPMTGTPGIALPDGWDAMPGARGCTPQSCAFRDHRAELAELGVETVFGLSAQSPEDQAEAASRLELPFLLLSDQLLELAQAMSLPTFEVEGKTLLKRFTLIIRDGVIEKVFYPVFPPDANASLVVDWLRAQAA